MTGLNVYQRLCEVAKSEGYTASYDYDIFSTLAGLQGSFEFADRMFDFDGLNALIGTPAMLEAGRSYEDTGA